MESIKLAECLQSNYGIQEGDVIGICSENRCEFIVIVFAAFYLGAAVAPINITYINGLFGFIEELM